MTIISLLKKPFFGRYQKPWRWPPGVDPAAWERIEIESASGARLAALHGASTGGPARGAIACVHPMATEAKGYFLRFGQADALRRAGYDVLLFDFNGFGESADGSFRFPMDILAAGKVLAARSGELPIGIYGLSMGAGYAICACSIDGHPFRAAFLEAPFTTLDEFWRRSSLFAYAVLRAMSALLPTLMEELRPIARIAKLQRLERMLLVYGSEDPFTPPSMGDRLVAACPPSTRTAVWIVPGAKHCQAQRVAGEEYAKRLVAFFDESFGPARGSQRSTA